MIISKYDKILNRYIDYSKKRVVEFLCIFAIIFINFSNKYKQSSKTS